MQRSADDDTAAATRMTDSPLSCCTLFMFFVQMRNVEFPELSHPPYTPGYACSGVIEALGSESLHFKVGDEVLVLVPLDSKLGGCAEFTVQPLINMCTINTQRVHACMHATHARAHHHHLHVHRPSFLYFLSCLCHCRVQSSSLRHCRMRLPAPLRGRASRA